MCGTKHLLFIPTLSWFQLWGMDIWPWPRPKDRQPRFSPENLNLQLRHKGRRLELNHQPKDSSWKQTFPWVCGHGDHRPPSARMKATHLGWQSEVHWVPDAPTLGCSPLKNKPQCVCLFVTCNQSHSRYSITFSLSSYPVFSAACNRRALKDAMPPSIIESWKFSNSLCSPLSSLHSHYLQNENFSRNLDTHIAKKQKKPILPRPGLLKVSTDCFSVAGGPLNCHLL